MARASGALAALAMLPAGLAHADLFQHEATLAMSVTLDSNPGLSPTAAKEIWRYALTPSYQLSRVEGADAWQASVALHLERSSNPSVSAGREDPSLSLGWQHDTPTGEFGLTAKYDESSTRSTELLDTGLVAADATRASAALSANWRSALDERNSLVLDGAYQNVSYQGGSFTDYAELSGGVTLNHAWSERAEPYIRYSVSRYAPDSGAAPSSSHTAVAGLKLAFSEVLSGSFHAGMSRTGGQAGSGLQGGAALNCAGRRSNLSLDMGRSTSASGAGAYVESDQLSVNWSYAISDRANAGIDLSWRENRSSAAPGTIRQIGVWTGRELDTFWKVRVSYQYKEVEQAGSGDVSAHVLGLFLTYSHPDFLDL